jgi:phosphatidylserine/phosphatidylglycerophosphate/cardiolipin synthase-like enzyme
MDALHQLTDADLSALAAALRSGRLAPPYEVVSIRRYSAVDYATTVTATLHQLDVEGFPPHHLARLMESIISARASRPREAEVVDLVWTGPEAPGTVNRDTAVVVRELFASAEADVLIAGFAVYQGREVFSQLARRMAERPRLRVRLFLNIPRHPTDTSHDSEIVQRFVQQFQNKEWSGERLPEIYYDPRSLDGEAVKRSSLHAKCVIVDREVALVTSANFTEAAQTRNIEVGALIRSQRFAVRLAAHFEALADAGLLRTTKSGS